MRICAGFYRATSWRPSSPAAAVASTTSSILSSPEAGVVARSPTDVVRDPPRARIDYMLQCQGCHLPDGRGIAGAVPSLQGIPGAFLRLPDGWIPYTPDEVGKLRETPLDQVTRARASLLSRLDAGY